MWFLWDMFDDVIDIASAPVKIVTGVTDAVITMWEGEPLTNMVDNLKDSIKTK